MPVYQYACTECGEQLEVRQSFTDTALTECPACEGRLRKVLNAVGVVFKGSGFYRNDSRAAANGGAGSTESSGATKAGESTSTSGDSEKSESKPGVAAKESATKGSSDKGTHSSGASSSGSSGSSKPAPAATH